MRKNEKNFAHPAPIGIGQNIFRPRIFVLHETPRAPRITMLNPKIYLVSETLKAEYILSLFQGPKANFVFNIVMRGARGVLRKAEYILSNTDRGFSNFQKRNSSYFDAT